MSDAMILQATKWFLLNGVQAVYAVSASLTLVLLVALIALRSWFKDLS